MPRNQTEIAAVHHGAIAGVVRLGAGWYDQEKDAHHRWAWTAQGGPLRVETWPRSQSVATQLRFTMRAPTPRTVVIRAEGREIWRNPIGTNLSMVSLPLLRVKGGRMELEQCFCLSRVRRRAGNCRGSLRTESDPGK